MLRHLTFAMQHHLNALTPLVISFPAQRRLQPTDLAFGAFDHLFPPKQMVKESHLASKGKPRPCPPPSTAAVSIQSAMEVVSDVRLHIGESRGWELRKPTSRFRVRAFGAPWNDEHHGVPDCLPNSRLST